MLEQILNGLFFGFLLYMLMGVVFTLLRSPRFYELVLWVAAPVGTYHYIKDFQASLVAFVFCGLFIVLADTAFQPERKQAQRKLPRPIVRSPNVRAARPLPDLKEAESRSPEMALPRTTATTPQIGDSMRSGRVRKHPATMSHRRAAARPQRLNQHRPSSLNRKSVHK
jgi:hypothetical protein